MSKKIKKPLIDPKIGAPPGTLIYTGNNDPNALSHVSMIDYNTNFFDEFVLHNISDIAQYKNTDTVTWVNIDGLHNVPLVEQFGSYFGLHPLLLEDILSVEQRPKAEDYGNYLFFTLKALSYNNNTNCIETEQICFVLGAQYVVSFQEAVGGDIFDNVRERLRTAKGKLRHSGADYLVYRLLDTVVDHYFLIMDKIDLHIEQIEETVLQDTEDNTTLNTIQKLKKDLIFLRKSLIPLRQAMEDIQHGTDALIKTETRSYLKDVYDHTLQVIEEIETSRDVLNGIQELYHNNQSNRMNSIMKVLTIMSSIFIPLTFVAGVYGMNFENMPELKNPNGYYTTWIVMALIAIVMTAYFRYRRWL